jgi:hypothetical protein
MRINSDKSPSTKDLRDLHTFLIEKALTCIHEPAGMLKYKFVIPSYGVNPGGDDHADVSERSTVGHYLQMYDWDSCFFSQAQSFLGQTGLATAIVANFLSLNRSDGYIPRTISPSRIWDGDDLCKPFLCQALLKEISTGVSRRAPFDLLLDLDCYLQYYQRTRKHSSGLFHWRNALESGVDDAISLIAPLDASKDENDTESGYPDGRILAVDLNCYLVSEFRAFATLAKLAGHEEDEKRYLDEANKLAALINETLWNPALKIYCDFDPKTSRQIPYRTWTGLLPFALGIAPQERQELIVTKTIMNEDHFLRPSGLSSVAASEPLYNQARRGIYGRAVVSNWQGPMWVLPNVLMVRGLLQAGYKSEAREIARRCLATLIEGRKQTGTLHENYNAETGEPLWAPQFMSWNVLALELLELVS